jgi:hypothetical protein
MQPTAPPAARMGALARFMLSSLSRPVRLASRWEGESHLRGTGGAPAIDTDTPADSRPSSGAPAAVVGPDTWALAFVWQSSCVAHRTDLPCALRSSLTHDYVSARYPAVADSLSRRLAASGMSDAVRAGITERLLRFVVAIEMVAFPGLDADVDGAPSSPETTPGPEQQTRPDIADLPGWRARPFPRSLVHTRRAVQVVQATAAYLFPSGEALCASGEVVRLLLDEWDMASDALCRQSDVRHVVKPRGAALWRDAAAVLPAVRPSVPSAAAAVPSAAAAVPSAAAAVPSAAEVPCAAICAGWARQGRIENEQWVDPFPTEAREPTRFQIPPAIMDAYEQVLAKQRERAAPQTQPPCSRRRRPAGEVPEKRRRLESFSRSGPDDGSAAPRREALPVPGAWSDAERGRKAEAIRSEGVPSVSRDCSSPAGTANELDSDDVPLGLLARTTARAEEAAHEAAAAANVVVAAQAACVAVAAHAAVAATSFAASLSRPAGPASIETSLSPRSHSWLFGRRAIYTAAGLADSITDSIDTCSFARHIRAASVGRAAGIIDLTDES